MFLWFMQPDIWLTLITLTFLEIILGVDNIIFLSLVVAKLPLSQQNMARKLGFKLRDDYADIIADIHCVAFTYYPAAFYRADAGDFVPHLDSARGRAVPDL